MADAVVRGWGTTIKAISVDTTAKDVVQQHDGSWHKCEIVAWYEVSWYEEYGGRREGGNDAV